MNCDAESPQQLWEVLRLEFQEAFEGEMHGNGMFLIRNRCEMSENASIFIIFHLF